MQRLPGPSFAAPSCPAVLSPQAFLSSPAFLWKDFGPTGLALSAGGVGASGAELLSASRRVSRPTCLPALALQVLMEFTVFSS